MSNYPKFTEALKKPRIKKRIKIVVHSIFILMFCFVYIPSFNIGWPLKFPVFFYRDVFEYSLVTIFVYILYFVKGKEDINKKVPLLASLGLIMFILLSILAYRKNYYRYTDQTSFMYVSDDVLQYVGFGCLLFLLFIAVDNIDRITSNKFYKNWESLKESRNLLLRQQFTPHFLFNALNSVYSMSLNKHPQTPDTILKLSGMMRYLTDEVNVKRIPLDREIKFLHDYIAIEKIRFGAKANIKFNVAGTTKGQLLEPLLLVPLVENAFKHGFNTNNSSAFVHINLKIESKNLEFTVENSILNNIHSKEKTRTGKGLENLKKRLKLNYSKHFGLEISKQENIFIAVLKLKIEE